MMRTAGRKNSATPNASLLYSPFLSPGMRLRRSSKGSASAFVRHPMAQKTCAHDMGVTPGSRQPSWMHRLL